MYFFTSFSLIVQLYDKNGCIRCFFREPQTPYKLCNLSILSIYATLHVPQLTAGLCGTDTKQSGTREKAQKKKKKNEKLHQNLKKKKKILTRPMNGTFLQRNK